MSVRRLIARPPADPVRAGRNATFAVDSRGRPYRWNVRRVGEAKPRESGQAKTGRRAQGQGARRRLGPLRPQRHGGPRPHDGPVRGAGRDERADPRRAPGAHVVRGGRPGRQPRRHPRHCSRAASRSATRGCSPTGFRPASRTTGRPLLAFLDAQKIHYDITTDLDAGRAPRRAHRRARGRAARRAAALGADRARAAPPPVRSRRRAASRCSARTRCGAASASAATGSLRPLPPDAADPFGTRVRPLRRLPSGPRSSCRSPTRAATGLLTGVDDAAGLHARWRSPGPPDACRPRSAPVDASALEQAEARRQAAAGDATPRSRSRSVGEGTVIRVGLPEWGARLKAGAVPVAAAHAQHRRHPARRQAADPVLRVTARRRHRRRPGGRPRARASCRRRARRRGDPRADVARRGRGRCSARSSLTPVLLVLSIWDTPQLDDGARAPADRARRRRGRRGALVVVAARAAVRAAGAAGLAARRARGAAVPRAGRGGRLDARTCSSRSTS